MKLFPSTQLGKWSLILLALFILLFLFTTVFVVGIFKQVGGETFTDNLYIGIPMFSALFSAILALITGLVSVWKYKERSQLVYITIVVCLLIALLVIGESTSP